MQEEFYEQEIDRINGCTESQYLGKTSMSFETQRRLNGKINNQSNMTLKQKLTSQLAKKLEVISLPEIYGDFTNWKPKKMLAV